MAEKGFDNSGSWRNARRTMGERNAKTGMSGPELIEQDKDFFDTRHPKLKYPEQLMERPAPVRYWSNDPFQHLGRVGYTRNTYQFRGAGKDENNIYGSQHMKKTAWLEEMRRRVEAEKHGITAAIDASNIAGTADAYYLNSREKKNKYIDSWRKKDKDSSTLAKNLPTSKTTPK